MEINVNTVTLFDIMFIFLNRDDSCCVCIFTTRSSVVFLFLIDVLFKCLATKNFFFFFSSEIHAEGIFQIETQPT